MGSELWTAWLPTLLGLALLAGYEWHVHRVGRLDPTQHARFVHARLRVEWVRTLSAKPGFEIVAVQALRNSLMSATISASTAALAAVGAVNLAGGSLLQPVDAGHHGLPLRTLLEAILVVTLFASYVCSSMAMRYYGHASFVMSMPVATPEREALNGLAAEHVRRAGLLYSWGLRLFLLIAPMAAGIVHPWATLPASLLLLVALRAFDRPAELEVD